MGDGGGYRVGRRVSEKKTHGGWGTVATSSWEARGWMGLHAWTRTKFFATFSSSIASTVVFRVSDNTEGGMTTSHTTLVVTVVEGGGAQGRGGREHNKRKENAFPREIKLA
jgi:hypothetical protein